MPMPAPAEAARPYLPFLNPIEGDHGIEPLRDGTPVLIRPLRADDHGRLSLHAERPGFSSQAGLPLADPLMDIDHQARTAFVALVHEDGKLREIGVSGYGATGDGARCECAVTVAEDWRGRGLGVLLMRHLIEAARGTGFRLMFSIDAADNAAMRGLASHLGFCRRPDPDDGSRVIHSLDLR